MENARQQAQRYARNLPGAELAELTQSEAIARGFEEIGATERPRPCSIAERVARREAVYLTQNLLPGMREDMDSIVEAARKIQRAG